MSGCAGRLASDISADADEFLFYDSTKPSGAPGDVGTPAGAPNNPRPQDAHWYGDEGTSISAPLVAGYYALVSECSTLGTAPCTPQWDYTKESYMNDVTIGNNLTGGSGSCPAYLCAAEPGYDGPTGVGSISGAAVPGAPEIGGPTATGAEDAASPAACTTGPDFDGDPCPNEGYIQYAGANNAVLAAGIYPNGYDTTYFWKYGTTTDYGQTTPVVDAGSGTAPVMVSADLTGLQPGTTYHYQLVVENIEDQQQVAITIGYDFTFTTPADSLPTFGSINTVAGDGTAAEAGDGGFATQAELGNPASVAVDPDGNIYIADTLNGTVREVNAATGWIYTVAGGGSSTGDGGPATSEQLQLPTGIAVDQQGDIYIADAWAAKVYEVSAATGDISTVAGDGTEGYTGDGPAATEGLDYPEDVAVDPAGNLYIADSGDNRIREVDAVTGYMSTIAGNGTAGFNGDGPAGSTEINDPAAVAVDADGDVYIADWGNSRVREVANSDDCAATPGSCPMTTIDGDPLQVGQEALGEPSGVAVDQYGNVYASDFENNDVQMIAPNDGGAAVRAGTGTAGYSGDQGPPDLAELNGPDGVAVDLGSDVYICDGGNNVIREITAYP